GKSTVLAEAIRQILQRKPPKKENAEDEAEQPADDTQRRQFWRTSGQRLIAGMRYLGQWEERCEMVIEELAETGSVLCVEAVLEDRSRVKPGAIGDGLLGSPSPVAQGFTRALTQADILTAFQRETGLPEQLLRDDLPLSHDEVLSAFRNAVLGQEAACQAAAG